MMNKTPTQVEALVNNHTPNRGATTMFDKLFSDYKKMRESFCSQQYASVSGKDISVMCIFLFSLLVSVVMLYSRIEITILWNLAAIIPLLFGCAVMLRHMHKYNKKYKTNHYRDFLRLFEEILKQYGIEISDKDRIECIISIADKKQTLSYTVNAIKRMVVSVFVFVLTTCIDKVDDSNFFEILARQGVSLGAALLSGCMISVLFVLLYCPDKDLYREFILDMKEIYAFGGMLNQSDPPCRIQK